MSFLSPIDLYRTLTGLNHRINDLLFSMTPRPVLDTSQCVGDRIWFSDLFQLIEGKDIWSQLLRSSIDTIRLCGTLVSNALCNYNRSPKQLMSNQTFSHFFPSLRRLYITGNAANQIIISQLFVPLSTTLRDVHFTFDAPFNSSSYYEVVNSFTNHELSFYRMVFDFENDDIKEHYDAKEYEWKQMHLPNTVYLSLYIKRLDDLYNLLDIQSLPALYHLGVSFIKRGLINDVKLMNVNNITSRLSFLKLSYMSMIDIHDNKPINLLQLIDNSLLSNLFPQLTIFWSSGKNIPLDDNFAKLVILIVTHFEKLTEMIINKDSRYRDLGIHGHDLLRTQQRDIENLLRNVHEFHDRNRMSIHWTNYPELRIWL
ncbi:unnamed protein product [Adineta steineri]|uniref:Uncharacterized protein n=1 Tax=Adineta steineri TaxID=433720 RepID=A0A814M9A5_9BILA|nr:unnamed protein product [Adineta steineri]CAF1076440.1 unnamed protein product [Adineta steineri]